MMQGELTLTMTVTEQGPDCKLSGGVDGLPGAYHLMLIAGGMAVLVEHVRECAETAGYDPVKTEASLWAYFEQMLEEAESGEHDKTSKLEMRTGPAPGSPAPGSPAPGSPEDPQPPANGGPER